MTSQKIVNLITLASLLSWPTWGAQLSPRGSVTMGTKGESTGEWRKVRKAVDDLETAYQDAKSDEERDRLWKQYTATNDVAVSNAVVAAAFEPSSTTSFEMLEWVVTNRRFQAGAENVRADGLRAVELLGESHVNNTNIARVCRAIWHKGDWDHEPGVRFLKAVSDKNSEPCARGQAIFALARLTKAKAAALEDFENTTPSELPQERRTKYLDWVKDGDSKVLFAKAEKLLGVVIESYGDCPSLAKGEIRQQRSTIGKEAQAELFELRHLSLGKMAPDAIGVDLDGREMKLSSSRGKVVLLSFWASWCGPCMQMVPQERALARKMEGKPFALIGVNADAALANAKGAAVKEKMTWRSFWSGEEGSGGPIPMAWNIRGWPTVYVLDHKGVIRMKSEGYGGTRTDDLIEKKVTELVAKVEAEKR
ncbi:MAG: resA 7 [Verrucomicrobiales bacterium]|nr:resA 7 [Verrucomicrobiales bacterium]